MLTTASTSFLLKMPTLSPGCAPPCRSNKAISSERSSSSVYEMVPLGPTTAGLEPAFLAVCRSMLASVSNIVDTCITGDQVAQDVRRAGVEQTADGVADIDARRVIV